MIKGKLQEQIESFIRGKDFEKQTELCDIMSRWGSDKSALTEHMHPMKRAHCTCKKGWHNYTPVYSALFEDKREELINFFELGILFGCSLRGFAEYFSKGKIYGADVVKDLLVNTDNITSYYCNQDSAESIKELWCHFPDNFLFDIIIDDGKHVFSSNMNFLKHSIHMLKPGGLFIIEDLTRGTMGDLEGKLPHLVSSYNLQEAFIVKIPNPINAVDNNLFVAVRGVPANE